MAQPLKIKLTENDIEKMVNSVIFHLNESLTNPFSLPDELKSNPLMEGYYATYPVDKVEKYLKKRYGKYAYIDCFENDNEVNVFRIGIYNDKENESVVDKDMALCGYFPSTKNVTNDGKMLYIFYEPRHQNKINELVQDEEYIYHLTKTSKVDKILKNGLTPRTDNKKFKYPDRVYFFLHEPYMDDCLCLMQQFHAEEAKNKKIMPYNGTYILLAIDTEEIKDVNFSYDPNAFDCIYTYDNIPPSAIEIVCEIEQEYLNK